MNQTHKALGGHLLVCWLRQMRLRNAICPLKYLEDKVYELTLVLFLSAFSSKISSSFSSSCSLQALSSFVRAANSCRTPNSPFNIKNALFYLRTIWHWCYVPRCICSVLLWRNHTRYIYGLRILNSARIQYILWDSEAVDSMTIGKAKSHSRKLYSFNVLMEMHSVH